MPTTYAHYKFGKEVPEWAFLICHEGEFWLVRQSDDEILNVISWNAIHFVLGFTFLQVLCLIFLDRENFK